MACWLAEEATANVDFDEEIAVKKIDAFLVYLKECAVWSWYSREYMVHTEYDCGVAVATYFCLYLPLTCEQEVSKTELRFIWDSGQGSR